MNKVKNFEIKYIIEEQEGSFILYSLVETMFAGVAKNFVCSGSLGYCEEVKKRLEMG